LNQEEEPDDELVRAVDVTLILYAEHELAASTFACRITTSTLSDIYSSITSAIVNKKITKKGTLRGPLHGILLYINIKRRSK
jgi:citrate synthase